MGIQVVARRPGFYGCLRAPGERFEIASERDLGRWMDRADQPPEPVALPADGPGEPARRRRRQPPDAP